VRTETLDRFLSSVGEVMLASSQLRSRAAAPGSAGSAGLDAGFDRMERMVGDMQHRQKAPEREGRGRRF
jgi:hypothetical protein